MHLQDVLGEIIILLRTSPSFINEKGSLQSSQVHIHIIPAKEKKKRKDRIPPSLYVKRLPKKIPPADRRMKKKMAVIHP